MFTIKNFKDGDRLVIVFEGLENVPSVEKMLGTYISGMVGAISTEKPGDAAPVPQIEESAPKTPILFQEGPYKDRTPKEAMSSCKSVKEQSEVFKYFCCMLNNDIDTGLKNEIRDVLTEYLSNRFKDCIPDEYAKKLSAAQVKGFYIVHEAVINDILKKELYEKYNCKSWTGLLLSDEDILRKAVADIITEFKK